ncbi:MAG: SRPBCC family protein [Acidimicrobiia bacterium]
MSQVQRTEIVNGGIASTWEALSIMGAVQDWHPNVARAEVLTERDSGVGAARRVVFHDGNSAVERVIEESKEAFTKVEMTESPMLKSAQITISIKERSADTTEVTFLIDYGVKYGPVGWLMDVGMLRRVFQKVFTIALAGLSYHLETGDIVTDSVPARRAA